jgi:hypothetical protein
LAGYEFVEWNEDNFDLSKNRYADEAYKCNKFAFVSDYLRLFVLYNFGGIYLDCDVELLKSLDAFLTHDAFSGFENIGKAPTGVMGSKKDNALIGALLHDYDNIPFRYADGKIDLTTNVERITKHMLKYNGINLYEDKLLSVAGCAVYPRTFFCPVTWDFSESGFSEKTCAIHHFAGSWIEGNLSIINKLALKKRILTSLPFNKTGKTAAIWGIGRHTAALLRDYQYFCGDIKCNLIFAVSENNAGAGSFFGKPVVNGNDIKLYDVDEIVISSRVHEKDIYSNIQNLGIDGGVTVRRIYEDNNISAPIFGSISMQQQDKVLTELINWSAFGEYYNASGNFFD